jgi:hypothetical protein
MLRKAIALCLFVRAFVFQVYFHFISFVPVVCARFIALSAKR